MKKVYLAGGLRSGWQEAVIAECPGFEFFNPSTHNLKEPCMYAEWDLFHVKNCDIVFAFMERDNPSGYGLSLEIGFAAALNKPIILCDHRSVCDEEFAKRFLIVKECAVVVTENLPWAIAYLNSYGPSKRFAAPPVKLPSEY